MDAKFVRYITHLKANGGVGRFHLVTYFSLQLFKI